MKSHDPLMVRFPVWIEESGLPEEISSSLGPDEWILFRKLVEIEVDGNLIPGWASVDTNDLARWTGSGEAALPSALERLQSRRLIEFRQTHHALLFRISEPLPVPASEEDIRRRLADRLSVPAMVFLRYLTELNTEDRVQRVIYLYQSCFGISFPPRIAEDLEDIALNHDIGTIIETFEEAFHRKTRGLTWIKRRLASGTESA
ncbi:MAG: hypothetical protein DRI92_04300 [Aquificota bacterium]|nr:MAG: hypothetical protein DRI92_04300 [Aquificota bacterium]